MDVSSMSDAESEENGIAARQETERGFESGANICETLELTLPKRQDPVVVANGNDILASVPVQCAYFYFYLVSSDVPVGCHA